MWEGVLGEEDLVHLLVPPCLRRDRIHFWLYHTVRRDERHGTTEFLPEGDRTMEFHHVATS